MNFLFFTIFFPILGFLILVFCRQSLSKCMISIVGIGSIALSAIISFFVMVDFLNHVNVLDKNTFFFIQPIFTWISVLDFYIPIRLRLDWLSLSMLVMITWVSFLIHIYASWYMSNHRSYFLFFSYTNLFVANMIILVLADNLLFMYFGWEGVGVCSYLLIGFYYDNFKNGEAALKSFIMTRIGDIFLICAMFMLYYCCHTIDFNKLMVVSSSVFSGCFLNLITFCLLFAAIAKSAQLPLQTWLSDAMVAPTPVSALIHAATMITAGIYLIARTYHLFTMTPEILYLLGMIGSMTLIVSSCLALVQNNIKRILAYSTMGQISYMFIALAVQAREAAIFHLIMHAFFKALLFLSAGSLVRFCSGEQNIFRMDVSYKSMPFIYFSFFLGGASLSAIPIVTSGFYSKGDILWKILCSDSYLFIFSGLFGSFLTSLYTFRMVFVIFHNHFFSNIDMSKSFNSFFHYFPLLILSILSTVVGMWIKIFILGESLYSLYCFKKIIFELFVSTLVIGGLYLSSMYYILSYRIFLDNLFNHIVWKYFFKCCYIDYGFDEIYKKIFIKPYLFISRLVSCDPVGFILNFFAFLINFFSKKLVLSENGQLRYYAVSLLFGMVIILLMLILL